MSDDPTRGIDRFRANYPGAYDDVDDVTLARAVYEKWYGKHDRAEVMEQLLGGGEEYKPTLKERVAMMPGIEGAQDAAIGIGTGLGSFVSNLGARVAQPIEAMSRAMGYPQYQMDPEFSFAEQLRGVEEDVIESGLRLAGESAADNPVPFMGGMMTSMIGSEGLMYATGGRAVRGAAGGVGKFGNWLNRTGGGMFSEAVKDAVAVGGLDILSSVDPRDSMAGGITMLAEMAGAEGLQEGTTQEMTAHPLRALISASQAAAEAEGVGGVAARGAIDVGTGFAADLALRGAGDRLGKLRQIWTEMQALNTERAAISAPRNAPADAPVAPDVEAAREADRLAAVQSVAPDDPRVASVLQENAVSRGEVDAAEAELEAVNVEVAQAEATLAAENTKVAELELELANQRVADAQRELDEALMGIGEEIDLDINDTAEQMARELEALDPEDLSPEDIQLLEEVGLTPDDLSATYSRSVKTPKEVINPQASSDEVLQAIDSELDGMTDGLAKERLLSTRASNRKG